jgi:cyclopropane fatty-acyl-phospholipid synthase-like methyltransferase
MTLDKFYDGLFVKAQGKPSYAFNGWGSRRSQFRRYDVVRRHCGVRSGDSVLDWGCGTGDLYWYLHDHGIDTHYFGTDIVPEMVKMAKHNGVPRVDNFDVLKSPYPRDSFDHVICIGTVGAMAEPEHERWAVVKRMIDVGLAMSSQTLMMTFLTDKDGPKEDDGYHWYHQFDTLMMRLGFVVPKDVGVMVCADYHPHDVSVIFKHDPF